MAEEMEGEKGFKHEEFSCLKLNRGILLGKKGGPYTPVPTWKLGGAQDNKHGFTTPPPGPSARKLGANLWEIQDFPLAKMSRAVKPRHNRDKGLELHPHLGDPLHSPPDQPASATGLRRHATAPLMGHHKSIERSSRLLEPMSPSSYSSSMELAAYNPPITPTSSLDFKGRLAETGYSLKTSTELLKVLNRIWSLEEQHASNTSLVKALKMELNHARVHIEELKQERQSNRQEIDDLMKQLMQDKLVRKSKEQEKVKAAVQSVMEELKEERKLRKRSESLHRKLARELLEVKSGFSRALKELEREKKTRVLLEELCDEFARGVTDYEQEVRALNHRSKRDHDKREDRLILHISEAWLDEREQMKNVQPQADVADDTTIDRLKSEIETFLQAKRVNSSKNGVKNPATTKKDDSNRRNSLESIHFNGAMSAPQDAGDEESMASDLHCFDTNRNNINEEGNDFAELRGEKVSENLEEMVQSSIAKKKLGTGKRIKSGSSSSLQVQFEEVIDKGKSCDPDAKVDSGDEKTKSENYELREGYLDRKGKRDGTHALSHVVEDLMRTHLSFPEEEKMQSESGHRREDSLGHLSRRSAHSIIGSKDSASGEVLGLSSPVQQWNFRNNSPDIIEAECSSKWGRGVKENTLKAKLLEARLEGQHARLKNSKASLSTGLEGDKS